LCRSKVAIFRNASIGFFNNLDPTLQKLDYDNNKLIFDNINLFSCKMNRLIPLMKSVTTGNDELIINNFKIKPFILTSLSEVQYSLAFQIAKL